MRVPSVNQLSTPLVKISNNIRPRLGRFASKYHGVGDICVAEEIEA